MDSAGWGVRFRDCEAGLTAVRLPKASCLGGWNFVPLERWPGDFTLLRSCGAWFLTPLDKQAKWKFLLSKYSLLVESFFQSTGSSYRECHQHIN